MQKLSEHPVVVILGIISSCIAIFVFCTGITQISELLKPSDDSSSPTQLITQVSVTNPVVEQPATHPVASSEPTQNVPVSTENPNTPPESILDVGQSWQENGFVLALIHAGAAYACQSNETPREIGVELKFQLTNKNSQDISIRYSMGEAVSAMSNHGQNLDVGHLNSLQTYGNCGYSPWVNTFEEINTIIGAGKTLELYNTTNTQWDNRELFIRADPADTSLTEIIVSVSGIVNIKNARWRIPILH